MLPKPIGTQGFEPISRRHAQVTENARLIEETQLAQSDRLNIRRQTPTAPTRPDELCFWIGEILNHAPI